MAKKKSGRVKRIVRAVLGAILGAAALAALYLGLIIAQPAQEDADADTVQPSLTASPALTANEESDLRDLVAAFPVPVMSFVSGSGMTFVSGESADFSWSGGIGRMVTLYWQTESGDPLILRSVYPAAALEILSQADYHFSAQAGPTLFGLTSVRMENDETVRLHAQTDTGLYIVIAPSSLSGRLSRIAQSIQLFTVSED